jgi:hypothetical protein
MLGLLGLVNAAIGFVVRRQFDPAVTEYLAPGTVGVDAVVRELSSSLTYAVVAGLAVAIVVLPLALALRGPARWARVATWIFLTVYLAPQIAFITANPTSYAEPNDRYSTTGQPLWDNLVPDWYAPSQNVMETLVLAFSIAVFVLLALPTAREYFGHKSDVAEDDPRLWDTGPILALARSRR